MVEQVGLEKTRKDCHIFYTWTNRFQGFLLYNNNLYGPHLAIFLVNCKQRIKYKHTMQKFFFH